MKFYVLYIVVKFLFLLKLQYTLLFNLQQQNNLNDKINKYILHPTSYGVRLSVHYIQISTKK